MLTKIKGAMLDPSAISDRLGYTPLNKAGDTMTGILNLGTIGQIKFPAAQNASSDANTLDDYEEGTWTPSSLVAISNATGKYTKIGRVVQFSCTGTFAASGSGTAAYMGGLPFTCESSNSSRSGSVISYTDYGAASTVMMNNGDISFFFYNLSGSNLSYSAVSGKTFYVGGTYLANT